MSDDAEDPQAILDWLDEKPTLSRHAGAVRKLDQVAAQQPDRYRPIRLGVVRNFTIETEEPFLRVAGYRNGLRVDVQYSGYDPNPAATVEFPNDELPDVLLVALRLEELAPGLASEFVGSDAAGAAKLAAAAVDQVIARVMTLRTQTAAPILVHNFVPPIEPAGGLLDRQNSLGELNTIRRINLDLVGGVAEVEGAYVVDVDHLFSSIGIGDCIDARGARSGDAPLSIVALRALADAHVRHLLALRGPRAKCVVVDADNTLWGGVIGEDGVDGIELGEYGAGRRYRDFQQHLLDLKQRGVVLAICSKNEPADVARVLRDHPDCLLSEDDFAASRVNWQDKAENLLEIAAELNLGLEHLVFVDDNPVEVDSIRTRLPAITVVRWPDDLGDTGTLDALALFDSLTLTEEDRERSAMYRAEGERARAREAMPSVPDYLRSLEMVATVGEVEREHLARVAQLTQRTNQFNLTTRRYEVGDIEAVLGSGTKALWLALSDKFGKHGIVGCGLLCFDGADARVDILLLSCRVLGRDAEAVLVNRLAKLARSNGASALVGEFFPTERNGQVADLYTRLGFASQDSSADGATWRWDLTEGDPQFPDWFQIIDE